MSELSRTLKHSVPDVPRVLDLDRVLQRGERLRLQRRLVQAGGAVVGVLAMVVLMRLAAAPVRVEFVPPADRVTESPTPTPELQRRRVESDARPRPQTHRDATGASRPDPEVAAASPPAVPPPTVDPAPQPPAKRPPAASREPSPRESVRRDEREERDHSGPTSCVLLYEELERGNSATCSFTAATKSGYWISGSTDGSLDFLVGPGNPRWIIDVRRGGRVRTYKEWNRDPGCTDGSIRPGDRVTATLHRPQDIQRTGSIDIYVGDGYGCSFQPPLI